MHFTTLAVAALVSSLASVSASPIARDTTNATRIPHDQVNVVVQILDAQGRLEWTEVEGGKVTFVSHAEGAKVISNSTTTGKSATTGSSNTTGNSTVTKTRRDQQTTPGNWAAVHSWIPVAEIDGFDTSIACIDSGDTMVSSIIQAGESAACTALSATPFSGIIDNGWYVFQEYGLRDLVGGSSYINWRWANLGTASTVSFTQSLCTAAVNELLESVCLASGMSQGGSIEVAGNDGFIVGFDPNSD